MITLGTCIDGRALSYDATLYEFRLDRAVVAYKDVAALDAHAHITWNAPEQRDWFKRINPSDLDACNRRALKRHGNGYDALSPEEQVQADAARDDSVLAGKIVEADPALVRAVVDSLEAQGLVGHASHAHATTAGYAMPIGMEPLAQLQRQEGRQMTLMEHLLMRRILKEDDKAKLKREKQAAHAEAALEREEEREAAQLEGKGKISSGQARMARKESRDEEALRKRSAAMQVQKQGQTGGMTIDHALAMAETGASARLHVVSDAMTTVAGSAGGQITYTDSYGNPIRPEADAMRPSLSQVAYGISEEEAALTEMRARNLAEQSRYQTQATDVPGMEGEGRGRGRKRNDGASINGHEVNADGTPKETGFTKFVGGLGKVADAVSPLVGGGRGGGMGGH